jgi:uncharacterized protein YjiS (DUF1127 family)
MKGRVGCVHGQQERVRQGAASRLGQWLRQRLGRWGELHRQRLLLAQLDDNALKDLGLSRADVYQEAERHFWDDPLKRC